MSRYGIETRYRFDGPKGSPEYGEYRICDYEAKRDENDEAQCVWSRPIREGDDDCEPYPPDVCAEYERLCGRPEFVDWDEPPTMPNLVELLTEDAEEEQSAWDQPCAFGHRIGGHAVYCHNEKWLYAPRKCRRTWYTGGETRDEDCRGFKPNPLMQSQKQ